MPVFSTRIVLDCFYLLIFYSEKFSTEVCRLPYAVNVNLNLSIAHKYIPANFFRDIGVRFLPWSAGIFEDDTIISEDFRSPKFSEEARSLPKMSKVF